MNDRQKYRSGIAIAAKMRSGGAMRDKRDKRSSGVNYSREYISILYEDRLNKNEEADMNYVYAFVYNGDENWKASSIDDWDFDNIELDGTEKAVGHKKLDGSICKVFKNNNGKVIAIIK